MKSLFLFIVLLLLNGCSTVTSLEHVGLNSDAKAGQALSGDWTAQNGDANFAHQGDGRVTVSIKPPKKGIPAALPFDVYLRRSGAQSFVSLVNPDDKDMPGYLFLRYRQRDDGNLEAWIPDSLFFREAIEEGRLAGEIQGSRFNRIVLITATQQELADFLAKADETQVWDMDAPIALFAPGQAPSK